MRDHSSDWDDALTGSVTPVVQVDAWYDGDLVAEALPGVQGSVTFDSTRLMVASAALSFADPDGVLAATGWGSPLAAYGSELHVRAGLLLPTGPELVSLGWLRVDSSDAVAQWQAYRKALPASALPVIDGGNAASPGVGVIDFSGTAPIVSGGNAWGTSTATADPPPPVWVPRGATVDVQCSDRMSLLDDDQFLTPQQPGSLASVLGEIQRLCQGRVPVADLSGWTDAAIGKSVTYGQSRTQALSDLAALLGASPRIDSDGALTLVPSTPAGATAWVLSVAGDLLPGLAGWTTKTDRAGLYNAAVVSGTDAYGNPLQGIAVETNGPLRYGGPLGRIPYFVNDPLATTQAAVDATARSTLARLVAQRTVTLPVTCPLNYALEVDDVVELQLPDRTLSGPVVTVDVPLAAGSMQIGVAVPRAQLWPGSDVAP